MTDPTSTPDIPSPVIDVALLARHATMLIYSGDWSCECGAQGRETPDTEEAAALAWAEHVVIRLASESSVPVEEGE